MSDKYIALIAGVEQEVAGTVTGGTVAQDGKIVALDTSGRIDPSLMPVGVTADVFATTANETLAAGDFVYILSSGKAAKASANSGGNPAIGYVLSGAAINAACTVYLEGTNTSLTGLTVGSRYYLSDSTPGAVSATPVVAAAGKIHQYLGRALTTTSITTEIDDHIVRAA